MATVVTKTVGPAKDYGSANAFELGEQADITLATGNDTIVKAECYSFQDTTAVTFNGWTTAAGNYIEVYTPTAERHDGKWNTSKYRLEVTDATALYNAEDYFRADGLQIASLAPTANGKHAVQFAGQGASNDIRVSSSVIKCGSQSTYWQQGISLADTDIIAKIWNCAIYDVYTGASNQGRGIEANCATADIYNCTIYEANRGINKTAGTITVKNCAVFNCTDDFAGSPDTIDYCASDDGDGTNAQTLDATSNYANEFEDVTTGNFQTVTGSVCVGNGVDDPGSGLYSDDINGVARTSPWDISAHELTAVIKTVTDAGGGSDTIAQLLASLTVTDVGTGTESSPVGGGGGVEAHVSVSDVGSGSDAIGAISALLTVLETATGSDAVAIIGAIKMIIANITGRSPSVSFTGKKPTVTFTPKKPGVDFDPAN